MLTNILHLIIFTLMSLFLVIVIMRFLLQVVRADFYNPVSQSIVKITMPLLKPLRKIIPGFLGIDMASVVLILLVQLVATLLLSLVHGVGDVFTNPLLVLLWGFVGALSIVSNIFFWCMVITIIGSFLAQFSHHPLIVLANQIIDPLCAPIRKVIPPLGGVLDISPIIILLGLKIVDMLIIRLAVLVQLNPQIVIGYWS
ncbi:MAG: YggT family protein [Pseudomonadota bacterium]